MTYTTLDNVVGTDQSAKPTILSKLYHSLAYVGIAATLYLGSMNPAYADEKKPTAAPKQPVTTQPVATTPENKKGENPTDKPIEVETIIGPKGHKTYRIKHEFIVEGRVQKPNAFYVLERSGIGWQDYLA